MSAILGLIAIGLAVIFGIRGVINLAHGELFMLGAYTAVWFSDRGWSTWWALMAAPVAVGVIGIVIEVVVVRHLYDRPVDTLVATFALSLIIRELIKLLFGKGSRNIPMPLGGQVYIVGTAYPQYRIFLIIVGAVVMASVAWVFLRTDVGVKVRAVIQRRPMAETMGINGRAVDRGVFAFGAALAGLAGVLMAPLITINPGVGPFFLARSFLVVILGGVGSIMGTVAGAVVIGIGEGVISSWIEPIYSQMLLFAMAIMVLRLRPAGLFGRPTNSK